MTDAQIILKLIEEVDPSDTDKLDAIDARVCVFLGILTENEEYPIPYVCGKTIAYRFTRSRDTLKVIRPEGWLFGMHKDRYVCGKHSRLFFSPADLTEELAELHAIIQTIAWERNND